MEAVFTEKVLESLAENVPVLVVVVMMMVTNNLFVWRIVGRLFKLLDGLGKDIQNLSILVNRADARESVYHAPKHPAASSIDGAGRGGDAITDD